ncbi:indole-3-glycerol phosphate synthase TrpC [Sediminibacterium roseum]|uniref:indole-3-glycerol-phosphate synthase n=1 Tax=Sediminibacterium roseum TaxID=1978412 RepID=A0ABW9ZVP5_9BACT|nr:indole-3-glycerol phosphate synthase TrpC [Sediminibacterium roseum]NCI51084.1 indole-3-glycerol phosphate synthase TrpC [Sediminibacterium roseum]
MNILDTIIAHKKKEVAARKQQVSVAELEKGYFFSHPVLSLRSFLADPSKTGIIAEYKRKSPSKGIINDKATVEEVTMAYAANGASGISVLTDHEFFGGSLQDLTEATINEVPLLRKDFMIDEYQLIEAKSFGAEVILLIAACLSPAAVKTMATTAKQLGLEVLLEVHNEEELGHVCEAVDLVGVNNRNLKTFEVSIDTSLGLINKIPKEKPAVAESGISDVNTIVTLREAGFKGFLIGENFMKEASPSIAFADFVNQLKAS